MRRCYASRIERRQGFSLTIISSVDSELRSWRRLSRRGLGRGAVVGGRARCRSPLRHQDLIPFALVAVLRTSTLTVAVAVWRLRGSWSLDLGTTRAHTLLLLFPLARSAREICWERRILVERISTRANRWWPTPGGGGVVGQPRKSLDRHGG